MRPWIKHCALTRWLPAATVPAELLKSDLSHPISTVPVQAVTIQSRWIGEAVTQPIYDWSGLPGQSYRDGFSHRNGLPEFYYGPDAYGPSGYGPSNWLTQAEASGRRQCGSGARETLSRLFSRS